MITYILKVNCYCTIGKTKNLQKRLRAYTTHSPKIDLVRVFEGDYEAELHKQFASKRIDNREWFRLSYKDIASIDVPHVSPYLKKSISGVTDSTWCNPFNLQSFVNTVANKRLREKFTNTEMGRLASFLSKIEPYTNKLVYDDKTSLAQLGKDLGYSRNHVSVYIKKLFELDIIRKINDDWIFNPRVAYTEDVFPDVLDLFSDSKL